VLLFVFQFWVTVHILNTCSGTTEFASEILHIDYRSRPISNRTLIPKIYFPVPSSQRNHFKEKRVCRNIDKQILEYSDMNTMCLTAHCSILQFHITFLSLS
jgi:hypothetical protein